MRKSMLSLVHWILKFEFTRIYMLEFLLWYTGTKLVPLNKRVYEKLESNYFGKPKQNHVVNIRLEPSKNTREGWMLMKRDVFLGYLSYAEHRSHWYVHAFAVKSNQTGLGYGTILGLKLLNDADYCGKMLVADVFDDKTRALCRKAEFEVFGDRWVRL
jgi:hypothetical protein